MDLIKLTTGEQTLVDKENFQWLNQWKWRISKNGYVVRKEGDKTIYLHRFILNTPKGLVTDHKDQNRLNNQKANLRVATHSQNKANRPMQANNKSGYKSVYWDKGRKKWFVNIRVDGKSKTIGRFTDKVEAAKAYNAKAKELFGEFAHFNTL